MLTIHGLKNCDSCTKARKWLDKRGFAHRFSDVRADGVDADRLDLWIAAVGWEALLNRRGTTWRNLDESMKADVDADHAKALMLNFPALIKRPVFEIGDDDVLVGFKTAEQQRIADYFGAKKSK